MGIAHKAGFIEVSGVWIRAVKIRAISDGCVWVSDGREVGGFTAEDVAPEEIVDAAVAAIKEERCTQTPQ